MTDILDAVVRVSGIGPTSLVTQSPPAVVTTVSPNVAFMPAFQLECQARFLANSSLISEVELLQHRQVLLDVHNNTGEENVLPGLPRDSKWR